jgi:hypothetical protein
MAVTTHFSESVGELVPAYVKCSFRFFEAPGSMTEIRGEGVTHPTLLIPPHLPSVAHSAAWRRRAGVADHLRGLRQIMRSEKSSTMAGLSALARRIPT